MPESDRLDPIQRHIELFRRDADSRTSTLETIQAQQVELNSKAEVLRRERADLLAVIAKLEA